MVATLVTQSRMASLMASLSVRLPVLTPTHLGAQQAHAKDVQPLAAHVLFAHVDDAFEAEQRANGRGGYAVLARAGFSDDALLAHPPRQQRLAEAVVDFVRAGMQQVFALEINARAAEHFCEPAGEIERRGTSGVGRQQFVELRLECRIIARFEICAAPALRAATSALRARSGPP